MSKLGQSALALALSDIGQGAEGGRHQGAYVTSCLSYGHPGGKQLSGLPWCVGAVNRWYGTANGGPLLWPYTLECSVLRQWLIDNGFYVPMDLSNPAQIELAPGDLIFYDWGWTDEKPPHHVALVQRIDPARRTILDVGGNHHDEVAACTRGLRSVMGFGRLLDEVAL